MEFSFTTRLFQEKARSMEVTTKKHSSSYKSTSAGSSSTESNFLHKRRRSSNTSNKSDVSKLPPAIQVWAEDDSTSSGSCSLKTETNNTTSSEDDEDDLQLTPKVVPCSAGGSMFLMPEVSRTVIKPHKKLKDIDQTSQIGHHLQVPFPVPRRRHSWICG